MANEVTVQASLAFSKSGFGSTSASDAATQFSCTATSPHYYSYVQLIGTAEETLLKGEIGSIGYVYVKNLDSTDSITLRSVTATAGSAFCKLAPGQFAVFPSAQTNIYALSTANTPALQVTFIEL